MLKQSFLLLACVLLASNAFAEGPIACDATCPSGERMTSFADGSDVVCVCSQDAAMDPTVADPNVPTGEDPNNTH
jgi:hypothetical protein